MTRREGELEDKPEHFTRMLQGFSPGNEKYDLSKDPHEFINLWDVEEYGEIKERLKTALLNRLISTEDCKQVREANY